VVASEGDRTAEKKAGSQPLLKARSASYSHRCPVARAFLELTLRRFVARRDSSRIAALRKYVAMQIAALPQQSNTSAPIEIPQRRSLSARR